MTESPRPQSEQSDANEPGRTTKSQGLSGPMLLLATALDTTWRVFVPPIGGTFLGIWLDHLFNITPVATTTCLILGTIISLLLVWKQLKDVQGYRR